MPITMRRLTAWSKFVSMPARAKRDEHHDRHQERGQERGERAAQIAVARRSGSTHAARCRRDLEQSVRAELRGDLVQEDALVEQVDVGQAGERRAERFAGSRRAGR